MNRNTCRIIIYAGIQAGIGMDILHGGGTIETACLWRSRASAEC